MSKKDYQKENDISVIIKNAKEKYAGQGFMPHYKKPKDNKNGLDLDMGIKLDAGVIKLDS